MCVYIYIYLYKLPKSKARRGLLFETERRTCPFSEDSLGSLRFATIFAAVKRVSVSAFFVSTI